MTAYCSPLASASGRRGSRRQPRLQAASILRAHAAPRTGSRPTTRGGSPVLQVAKVVVLADRLDPRHRPRREPGSRRGLRELRRSRARRLRRCCPRRRRAARHSWWCRCPTRCRCSQRPHRRARRSRRLSSLGRHPRRSTHSTSPEVGQQLGELLEAGEVVPRQQEVDVRRGHHHPERRRPKVDVVALVGVHPDHPMAET